MTMYRSSAMFGPDSLADICRSPLVLPKPILFTQNLCRIFRAFCWSATAGFAITAKITASTEVDCRWGSGMTGSNGSRSSTDSFGNALTGFRLPEHNINFFIKKVYTTTRGVKEIIELPIHNGRC